jgi:hypothetical protein
LTQLVVIWVVVLLASVGIDIGIVGQAILSSIGVVMAAYFEG